MYEHETRREKKKKKEEVLQNRERKKKDYETEVKLLLVTFSRMVTDRGAHRAGGRVLTTIPSFDVGWVPEILCRISTDGKAGGWRLGRG